MNVDGVTEIPSAVHGTSGRLFRSCLPLSQTLDGGDEVLPALIELVGAAALWVVAAPPNDEAARLSGGVIADVQQFYADRGVRCSHAPWLETYEEANHERLRQLVAPLAAHLRAGGAVVAHCHSGFGRGGVILAALLAELGVPAPIDQLRSVSAQFLAQDKPRQWAAAYLAYRHASSL